MLSNTPYSDSMAIHPEITRIINLIDDTAQHTHRLGLESEREAQSGDHSARILESVSKKLS